MKKIAVLVLMFLFFGVSGQEFRAQDKSLKKIYINYSQFAPKSGGIVPMAPQCTGQNACCTTCDYQGVIICIVGYPSDCVCVRFPNYAVAIYCNDPCWDAWEYCNIYN
jgi:hypothetical protein